MRAFGLRIAASHSPEFSLLHERVSCAYFHAETHKSVLVKLPAEDCSGKDVGKIGLLKKSMYGTRTQHATGKEIGKSILKIGVVSWGASSRNLFHTSKKKT